MIEGHPDLDAPPKRGPDDGVNVTRPHLSAYLALASGVLILGSSAILVRWADAPGIVTAFYRMAIGSLLVSPYFLVRGRHQTTPLRRQELLWAVLGGLFFGLDLTFWTTGIMLAGATNPTLMANTAPLWVGLGALLFFGERRRGLFWAGLALALLGSAVVLGEDLSQATALGLGTFLGLLAAIFYGAYLLITQRARVHLATVPYFWIATTSAATLLLMLVLLSGSALLGYRGSTVLAFLASGTVVQVLGWLVVNYAQGYLPASVVSPTLLVQPLLTAVFAALLLGERLTIWHLVGGTAVLAGVYLVHRSRWAPGSRKHRKGVLGSDESHETGI